MAKDPFAGNGAKDEDDPFGTINTDYVKFQIFENHLLIVKALREQTVTTKNLGERVVTVCDIVDMDADGGPAEHRGVFFFGQGLQPTLARQIGDKPLLGILGKGTAKPGQNAAWRIDTDNVSAKRREEAKKFWNARNPFAEATAG